MDKEQHKARRMVAYPPEYVKAAAIKYAEKKNMSANEVQVQALTQFLKSKNISFKQE